MKCPKCKKEMQHVQKEGKDYHVCLDCQVIRGAGLPSSPPTNSTDTVLRVLLGLVLFTIVTILSGLIIWGVAESGQTQQPQNTQTVAAATKALTRSDLIKQGKIKVKKQPEKSKDPTPDAIPQTDPAELQTAQTAGDGQDPGNATPAQQNEQMVWLTATGKKYHNRNDCGFTDPARAYQVTVSYAEEHSDGPCKICFGY